MGNILPLVNILKRSKHINTIILPPNTINSSGNNDAVILGNILLSNNYIDEIIISNQNIKIDGLRALCKGIEYNKNIKRVNISNCFIGPECIEILIHMLENNKSLKYLNVNNLNLEYENVYLLKKTIQDNELDVVLECNGNYV